MSTLLPFGAEDFFVRQAPNHKHLKEPAAPGAAATTFVMTLPVPQRPGPIGAVFAIPAIVHASERPSSTPAPWPILTDVPMLGELCLVGLS